MFGLIIGLLAVACGIVGIKYSIQAIVFGIVAMSTFFRIKKGE